MSTPVPSTQVRSSVGTYNDPGSAVSRDRAGLLKILEDIDRAGWDSRPAETLLEYIRATVVRPNVASTGLTGPAADQAETTAWAATWEALTLQSLRSALSPWGVLWATARRAVMGELVAGVYCTDVRAAWRLARPDAAGSVASDRVADTRGAFPLLEDTRTSQTPSVAGGKVKMVGPYSPTVFALLDNALVQASPGNDGDALLEIWSKDDVVSAIAVKLTKLWAGAPGVQYLVRGPSGQRVIAAHTSDVILKSKWGVIQHDLTTW